MAPLQPHQALPVAPRLLRRTRVVPRARRAPPDLILVAAGRVHPHGARHRPVRPRRHGALWLLPPPQLRKKSAREAPIAKHFSQKSSICTNSSCFFVAVHPGMNVVKASFLDK